MRKLGISPPKSNHVLGIAQGQVHKPVIHGSRLCAVTPELGLS
jgi:hypothetical protein